MQGKTKAQTALEYVMIVGGAIMFVVIVVLIIRSGIIGRETEKIKSNVDDYSGKYLKDSVLFWDNFDAGTASKWLPVSGAWAVANKKYVQSAGGADGLTLTRSGFGNFSAEFEVRKTGGFAAGAVFRSNAAGTQGYSLVITDADAALYRDGVYLTDSSITFGKLSSPGVLVKISAYGNALRVYIDDALVFSYDTSADATKYYYGQFGLQTTFGGTAEFDDVVLWKES